MKKNLIEKLQQAAGYPSLHKIDPNTQTLKIGDSDNRLSQAVIVTVLTGFYKFTRIEQQSESIARARTDQNWFEKIYGKNQPEVIARVAEYSKESREQASSELNKVSNLAAGIIDDESSSSKVTAKHYMTGQRNAILHHLPEGLNLGKMLNDETLDDRTNKMDGPVSGTIHRIEKIFAGTDNPGEKK